MPEDLYYCFQDPAADHEEVLDSALAVLYHGPPVDYGLLLRILQRQTSHLHIWI